jgi:hypothetical protein
MYISLATSSLGGFKKWSDAHPPASNDHDFPAGVTPIAIAVPRLDDPEATQQQTHVPWLVPGVGASF